MTTDGMSYYLHPAQILFLADLHGVATLVTQLDLTHQNLQYWLGD